MNIFKTLRKPYFAIFFASLVLFTSCNKDSLSESSEIQTQTLDEYIVKHVELTLKFIELKNSINYDVVDKLTKLQRKSIEPSDLKFAIKNENIDISNDILELEEEIIENTRILYNNPEYSSLTQKEFLNLIKNSISDEFENPKIILQSAKTSNSCLDAFNSANEKCLLEFTLSAGTVGVVGLFTTFGIGTLIGGGVALIRFGECNKNAQAVLEDCRNGGGREDEDPRAPIPF